MKTKITSLCACPAVLILIISFMLSAAALRADEKPVILMYGSAECGLCNAMKRNLDAEKIPYTFYDVKKDSARNRDMWTKLQAAQGRVTSVRFPVMDIGGKILVSPKFAEVKALLGTQPAEQGTVPAQTPDSGTCQTTENDSVIIYGEGSSDETVNLCTSLMTAGINFKYVSLKNMSPAKTQLKKKVKAQYPDMNDLEFPVAEVKARFIIPPTAAAIKKNLASPAAPSAPAKKAPVSRVQILPEKGQ